MPDVTLNRPLQDLGTGDALALALKEFSGIVLTAFPTATHFYAKTRKHNITSGSSHQFPATWKMDASEHDPGTELDGGNEPESEDRVVAVDTKERVAHAWLTIVDQFIQHFSTRNEVGMQAALGVARVVDSDIARMIALGARQSARSNFPAGNVLDSPRAGATLKAAYPISLAGSKALQEDMAEIGQKMTEKDVPTDEGTRWGYLSPYLTRVLRQDRTLVSVDMKSPNNLFTQKVTLVENFLIQETNRMPSTNVTTGQSAYQGDYRTTAALFTGHPSAVGTVQFGGIDPFGPTWYGDKRAHLLGAAILKGSKWLRPEACGEITFDNS